jgi:hypothetical protein
MKNKATDLMLSIVEENGFNVYKDNKYITIVNRDLFNKSLKVKSQNLWETPHAFQIYTLDPSKKELKKIKDITVSVLKYYKKYNKTTKISGLLHIWDQYYLRDKNTLIFKLTDYTAKTTCSPRKNIYIAYYNFKTKRFNMHKMNKKYIDYTFLGVRNNLFVFWGFKKYHVVGLKYPDL